jgi:hypothetical protein
MKNKMTPTPWKINESNERWVYSETPPADGGDIIFVAPNMPRSATRFKANASAIVSAINCTYGAGIDPEAVIDLLAALKGMMEPFSHIGGVGYNDKLKAMEAAKAAIKKAIIK